MTLTILHRAISSLLHWFNVTERTEDQRMRTANEGYRMEILGIKVALYQLRCNIAELLYSLVHVGHQEHLQEYSVDINEQISHLLGNSSRYENHRRTVIIIMETESVLRSLYGIVRSLIDST